MVVNKKEKKIDKFIGREPISHWQVALVDARRSLGECQARARQLRRSVQIIEQKISAGESWPGQSATQN